MGGKREKGAKKKKQGEYNWNCLSKGRKCKALLQWMRVLEVCVRVFIYDGHVDTIWLAALRQPVVDEL